MNQKIIILLSTIMLPQSPLLASNNPVLVSTVQDNISVEISMNLEIDGTIKLYSTVNDNTEEQTETYKPQGAKSFVNLVLHPDKDFYIGTDKEAEEITPTNYRRLAKEYFKKRPELVENIGKRGFRYKNLPSMILYYNKITANEGGLTKEDIMANY